MRITLIGFFVSCSLTMIGQVGSEELSTKDNPTNNSIALSAETGQDYDQRFLELNENKKNIEEHSFENNTSATFHDSIYMTRLKSLPTKMELVFNSTVRNHINNYTKKGRGQVSNMLGEGKYYFPLFEEILAKEGLPLELKYLPIIESALNPIAKSKVGATGLWQFMLSTGKSYDLEINSLVDERRDPVKSTQAAVKYLKDLYSIYRDWNLVLAAYNCGPGNVNKAIHRSGGKKDFWEICDYLPKETQNYIPAFIATTYIMSFHKEHNIHAGESSHTTSMDSLKINQKLKFEQIANIINIPIQQLRQFNPQFHNDIVPGDYKEYVLKLPTQQALAFIDNEDAIYGKNTIKSSSSGRTNGTMSIPETIIPSNIIIVPEKSDKKETLASVFTEEVVPVKMSFSDERRSSTVQQAQLVTVFHEVGKGETLQRIAKMNDVTVEEIKEWNNIVSNSVKNGTKLKIEKIEYVSIYSDYAGNSETTYYQPEFYLREPEIAAIAIDRNTAIQIIDNYVRNTEKNIALQESVNNRISNDHLKLLTSANNFDYKATISSKKRNILKRLTNAADVAYSAVKNWGESVSEKIKPVRQAKVQLADNSKLRTELKRENIECNAIEALLKLERLETQIISKNSSLISSEDEASLSPASIASNDNSLSKVYHKVRIGETVTQIATRYNVSKNDIVSWNNLPSGVAKIRQRLLIFVPNDNSRLAANKTASSNN